MVNEALGEDELDGRAGTLVCGLGDKGTEFRSGGMIDNLTSALLVSVDLQRVSGSRNRGEAKEWWKCPVSSKQKCRPGTPVSRGTLDAFDKDLGGGNQINIYSTIMNGAKIAGLFNTPAIL